MNEPTEIKYPLDENGEPYYAATHISAVQGLNQENTDNTLTDMNNKINQMNQLITNANNTIVEQQKNIKNMVSVTSWVTYGHNVGQGVVADIVHGGNNLICALKEVRIGIPELTQYSRIKTISYNMRNFSNGQQIAQLPNGFVNKNLDITAYGSGDLNPYRLEVTKDGKVVVNINPIDRDKDINSHWVYGQYTWVE